MTLFTTLESKSRFHDVHFIPLEGVDSELMAVACEDGKGRIYAIPVEAPTAEKQLQCVAELKGHTKRYVLASLPACWCKILTCVQDQMHRIPSSRFANINTSDTQHYILRRAHTPLQPFVGSISYRFFPKRTSRSRTSHTTRYQRLQTDLLDYCGLQGPGSR